MSQSVVVVGLGYVGLPLAFEACCNGFEVVGLDTSKDVLESLNLHRSHVDDIEDAQIKKMFDFGFVATDDPVFVSEADYVIVCVPTPLSDDGIPDLDAVITASKMIASFIKPDVLVSLESTTYPGTTDGLFLKFLEEGSGLTAGKDFSLVYSPERIDPGNKDYDLRNTPKIVGGLTENCGKRGEEFYSQIVDTVVLTKGLREAELSKLLENTYRYVNIALVNELAVFCHELGVDIWDSIDAAGTKPFGFESFYPGPGVGGHCIPIDPNYLSWIVRSLGHRFRMVELAHEVSERMPYYIAKRVQDSLNAEGKPLSGSVILLLGVTYKPNISDQRQTPAAPLANHLLTMGAEVRFFDPYVDQILIDGVPVSPVDDFETGVVESDMAILVTAHDEIVNSIILQKAKKILDTRGVLTGENVERL